MKKEKILLLLLLLFPINVYALTGNTNISCSKTTLNPGESTTCSIKGTVSGDTVSAISAVLSVGSNMSIESITKASVWQGDNNDPNMDYYTSDNQSGTFDIATAVIKASSSITAGADVSISVKTTKFSSGTDFKETTINDSSKAIRITSTVNTLSGLTVSKGTLNPAFSTNDLSYAVSVEEDSITINATKTNEKSTISGDVGTKSLKYGNNNFTINVTSESGAKKTYSLNVFRIDNRDTDNNLKTLKVNGEEIEIVDGVVEYEYKVANSIDKLEIDGTLSSTKSSFVNGYGTRTVSLKEGVNNVEVRVMAENESVQVYTLKVTRESSSKTSTNSNSSSDVPTNNSDSSEFTNPKTGSLSMHIVVIILILSFVLGGGAYFFIRKEGKNSET